METETALAVLMLLTDVGLLSRKPRTDSCVLVSLRCLIDRIQSHYSNTPLGMPTRYFQQKEIEAERSTVAMNSIP